MLKSTCVSVLTFFAQCIELTTLTRLNRKAVRMWFFARLILGSFAFSKDKGLAGQFIVRNVFDNRFGNRLRCLSFLWFARVILRCLFFFWFLVVCFLLFDQKRQAIHNHAVDRLNGHLLGDWLFEANDSPVCFVLVILIQFDEHNFSIIAKETLQLVFLPHFGNIFYEDTVCFHMLRWYWANRIIKLRFNKPRFIFLDRESSSALATFHFVKRLDSKLSFLLRLKAHDSILSKSIVLEYC